MKLNIKIDNDILNRIISFRIKELITIIKIKRTNTNTAIIYQLAIETSIFDCFIKVIKKLKNENLLTLKIYNIVYIICESLLKKKFKNLYLNKEIYSSTGNFLKFAKKFYEKLTFDTKKNPLIYV